MTTESRRGPFQTVTAAAVQFNVRGRCRCADVTGCVAGPHAVSLPCYALVMTEPK